MVRRFVSLFLLQVLGAGLAWLVRTSPLSVLDLAAGVLLGSSAWLLLDASRGIRVLSWLRNGDVAVPAVTGGMWGEVADRVRVLVRARDQKAQESDRRLQAFLSALQASPNGVVMLDAKGRIEWFNGTAAGHFGLDSSRDLMQHFGNLVRDPGFAAYYASANFAVDVLMPGRASTMARPINLSLHLHPYGEGRLLLLSRDITALAQAEAMRRDFVANVSHEIRTPLTVLSGFVETLQTLELDPAQTSRYLDLMSQQARRMQTLVDDLLILSRLEGTPLPGVNEWVSAQSLVTAIREEGLALSTALNFGQGTQHQFTFDADYSGDLACAERELQSALSNLMSNAIRYTPAGGMIGVSCRLQADGRLCFSVSDTGPGIAPEHISRLTERFYRVDQSRSRDTGGTGLGLAIVKHVVQRHGATLDISSALGKGSRFSITLPATRVRPQSEA